MRIDSLTAVGEELRAGGAPYLEFLQVPALRAGLYELPAGSEDPQRPHAEDELYHVVSGRADFRYGDTVTPVGPGSVIDVEAGAPHRFVDIAEDLKVLVVFAPGGAA